MPLLRKRSAYNKSRLAITTVICILSIAYLSYVLHSFIKRHMKTRLTKGNQIYISKKTVLRKVDGGTSYKRYHQFQDFNGRRADVDSNAENKYSYATCSRLSDCFNFDLCTSGFYIYVYPSEDGQIVSPMYENILKSIKNSQFYTNEPKKACLFVPPFDTTDRDVQSKNFVKGLNKLISKLPYWNKGENHLIFNLFSGTWPFYVDNTFDFDIGKALVAKASYSFESVRQGYDLSIPLIPKDHPFNIILNLDNTTMAQVEKNSNLFPVRRKYLMSFKGKRYLHGIGSDTRNSLHLIHNNKDIVILTTCRHGKGWENFKDDRCDKDNEDYDRYDYQELLENSTFCIIPRGRRLGSFRFLEAMKYGCIPILLSNGWDLPFADVLDWSKFSLNIDEKLLLRLPTIIRKISDKQILSMKQQTLFVWHTYFSSVNSIVHTSLEIFHERIKPHLKHQQLVWNNPPGALRIRSSFSTSVSKFPFYNSFTNMKPSDKFTAVLMAVTPVYRSSSPLFKLIKSIHTSIYLDQILVVWLSSSGIPEKTKWPRTQVTLRVIHPPVKSMNTRFMDLALIKTDAIFTLDEDVVINTSEMDFAFSVWKTNPSQIVGFSTATHYLKRVDDNLQWQYTSKLMNHFSMIRTSSAIFHRYYSYLYFHHAPKGLRELVDKEKTCESIAMNFLASYTSGKAPIKVARSSQFKDGSLTKERLGVSFTVEQRFKLHKKCFDELKKIFNGVPLVHSKIVMDPVLYKDPVSISRKKYRRVE